MDEEMEGILELFGDTGVEDLESIETAAISTTSPASTSREIAAKMTEDVTMDNTLPIVPDMDDQAFSAISGTSGVWEGVVTGSSFLEVDKLAPISPPVIISTTSVVSWAEYQPTLMDELLTIPDIDQHSPIPISERPRPPSWLQPFLHEGAMELYRIHQEEIARWHLKGEDSKWSTITHAERFEDKPIDFKEQVIDSDEIVDSLEAIWPHAPHSEKMRMRGANLTEGELYCTENINTSVLSVGEDYRRPSNISSAITAEATRTRSLPRKGLQVHNPPIFDTSAIQPDHMRRTSIRGKGKRVRKRPIFNPSTIQSEDTRRISLRKRELEVHYIPIFDSLAIKPNHIRRTSLRGEDKEVDNRPIIDPLTIQSEDMRTMSIRGEGLEVHNPPISDTSTIQPDDMRRRSIRGKGKEVDNRPIFDPSTIQSEGMRRMSIRGEGLEGFNRPIFDPSTAQPEILQRWIQQHHISEVDTSVFQQEGALARQNFLPNDVGYDDQQERFAFLQLEKELKKMFGMPISQHGFMEMLMGDFMRSGLGGVGEGELPFNNSEYFGVSPQSEANNPSEEITTVTQPQLNLNRSESSQR